MLCASPCGYKVRGGGKRNVPNKVKLRLFTFVNTHAKRNLKEVKVIREFKGKGLRVCI